MFCITLRIPDYDEPQGPDDWTPPDPWEDIPPMERERLFDEMCQAEPAACGVQCPAWPFVP
ncbi:MAG: hypothetical protein WHV44_03640 [Anaerolineales bacterium]